MSTPTPYSESVLTTLPAPCPTSPVAGRPVETDRPVFDWLPVPDAEQHDVRYRVQIASTDAFDVLHYDEVVERGTALPLASVLPDDVTTACWRVRAEGADADRTDWSPPAHFARSSGEAEDGVVRVDAPPVPLQPGRAREAPVGQGAVAFAWEGVPEASGYQLQVATSETFDDPDVDLTVDRTTKITLSDELLSEAATFHWRLRSLFRGADPGPWSDPESFSVASPPDETTQAPESTDSPSTARAAGPVVEARTSGTFSLIVSLLVVVSFIATIALIFLAV